MAEHENSSTVKSVFKSGESTPTQREFTDKWIELINTIEKGKVQSLPKTKDCINQL